MLGCPVGARRHAQIGQISLIFARSKHKMSLTFESAFRALVFPGMSSRSMQIARTRLISCLEHWVRIDIVVTVSVDCCCSLQGNAWRSCCLGFQSVGAKAWTSRPCSDMLRGLQRLGVYLYSDWRRPSKFRPSFVRFGPLPPRGPSWSKFARIGPNMTNIWPGLAVMILQNTVAMWSTSGKLR